MWLSSLALCVLLVLGLYGKQTLALLGASAYTANTGVAGQVSVEVYSVTSGLNQADIGVTNTGTTDCYVRMMVMMPNESVTSSGAGNLLETGGFNPVGWTLGDDGYYYYNKVLPVGRTTDFLYRMVSYKDIPAEASLDQLQIISYAEAVQSAYTIREGGSDGLTEAQLAFQQVRQ